MAISNSSNPKLHRLPDPALLLSVLALIGMSLCIVYSASSSRAFYLKGDSAYYFIQHFIRVVLGIIGLIVFSRFKYQNLKYFGLPLLVVTFIALIILLIPGVVEPINNSKRWLTIAGRSLQPAEIAKFALIIFLADSINRRGSDLTSFPGYVRRLFLIACVSLLILLQPSFSSALMVGLIGFFLLYIGGAKAKHLWCSLLLVIPIAVKFALGAPYRIKRLIEYWNGIIHPEKVGHQVNQSLIGLGDGGLFGVGFGNSHQKEYFLPEPFTDFIFSILGEELGFIGAGITLFLFLLIAYRGIKIAMRAPDDFGFLLAGSITFALTTYAMVNLMVVTGLLPVTGLPLPFLTFGGSSLIVNMSLVGILLNISRFGHPSSFRNTYASEI
jgi:cell division protein FtsW